MAATDMDDYYFIAHLLDRVLVGRAKEYPYEVLWEAVERNTVLEVHLFNEQKEIFAVRCQDELVCYQTLEHEDRQEDGVITRSYRLAENFTKKDGADDYDTLEVKEYIGYDEDYLAYVEKTVLYRLKKAGE